MAFWHGRILPATVYFRRRGIVVITSENFDGEWIAGIIERFGYGTARGSTSRGAVEALVQLKRDMAAGQAGGVHARRPARPGARRAARRGLAGQGHRQPDRPVSHRSDRHWTANSWDRTQIPKPWSNVAIAIGEPMAVPRMPTTRRSSGAADARVAAASARSARARDASDEERAVLQSGVCVETLRRADRAPRTTSPTPLQITSGAP